MEPMTQDDTHTPEKKFKLPRSFSGKREDLEDFLENVLLYLDLNDKAYNTDKDKIGFVIALLTEGDAKLWKSQFLKSARTPAGLNLGTWNKFLTDLTAAFKPYDAPGDALEELISLRMGNNSMEDHVARFKALLTTSEVPRDSPSAIDYFRRTLNVPLQKKLLELATPPKDLDDWYKWALQLDNNYRKMQRVIGRFPTKDKKEEPKKRWTFQKRERDPNAMDVDTMSVERRDECMKKGLCFGCGEQGHLSKDCPKKKRKQIVERPKIEEKKKMNPKELYAHVRALTAMMDEKEKEEFYDEAEKEGF